MKKINLKQLKLYKYIKQKISNLKYHWMYLGVLNSPFVGLRLSWYFGRIKHGTPYFLPRKWVKLNDKEAFAKAYEKTDKNLKGEAYDNTFDYNYNYYKNYTKFTQIKYFGFNSCTLGWKTKWEWNDLRFEYPPCYSLVIFGKQLIVWVLPKMESKDDYGIRQDCYWEAYLTYKYCTNKTKSKEERLQETIKQYSCTWGNNEKGYIDYYSHILKNKYHGSIK